RRLSHPPPLRCLPLLLLCPPRPRPPPSLRPYTPLFRSQRHAPCGVCCGLDHRDLEHQLHRHTQLCPQRGRWHQDPLHLVQGRRQHRREHLRTLHTRGPHLAYSSHPDDHGRQHPDHAELV